MSLEVFFLVNIQCLALCLGNAAPNRQGSKSCQPASRCFGFTDFWVPTFDADVQWDMISILMFLYWMHVQTDVPVLDVCPHWCGNTILPPCTCFLKSVFGAWFRPAAHELSSHIACNGIKKSMLACNVPICQHELYQHGTIYSSCLGFDLLLSFYIQPLPATCHSRPWLLSIVMLLKLSNAAGPFNDWEWT